ncbi:unnamed protein product [Microthlaspi erraticum]|uniref:non-specific serine/threonine protein kinase n=1 Tax=Microthlaspi erraticum TaxID=1685480 RepID=A0A6D2I7G0_9BRAS|nr:unnamed protein product [Microthlaspi erraticum]
MRVLFCLLCIIALVYGQASPDAATMISLRDSLKLPSDFAWTGSDPCTWTGTQCVGKRITRIQIRNSKISGTLPPNLRNLSSLTVFEVMGNSITGAIPSFAGLRSLTTANFHDNGFTSIDADFFTGLSSLQLVSLDNNPFTSWEIPASLKDVTSLAEFSAVGCNLSGKIPDFLGGQTFPGLTTLRLSGNSLSGELPMSFAESPVQILMLNAQKLNGSISVLEKMTALTNVTLQGNGFSGPIPDISGLVSLKSFNFRDNQLTGIVPASLTESKSLSDVALGNNLLQGPTPSFKSAEADMSGTNSFCSDTPGTPCDPRVNTLLSIVEAFGYPVRFAESWRGNDPCDKWAGITCFGADVRVINFKNMGLNGNISPRFADLKSLQVIDLSQNNLTGVIPQEMTQLSSLKTLDVSNNRLYGKIPVFGPNVLKTSGNADIGKDGPSSDASSSSSGGKIVGSVIGGVLCLLLIGFAVFFFVKKKKRYHKMHPQQQHSDEKDEVKIPIPIENPSAGGGGGSESGLSSGMMEYGGPVMSIEVLRDATDNFSEKKILGRGGFGIVYEGELQDGTKVAVKRMKSSGVGEEENKNGLGEFKSEISLLTKVRHRNVVTIHGYCLQGNERLLVYEYMPQGTLSRHIFNWEEEGLKPLEWSRRLIIASDVARGVEYLHTLAKECFIHRDLKTTNILLGDDMHAKVADFGLVKSAPDAAQSMATKVAGTFGYLAPEYALTGRVTTKVDVYSFGVILMELLTGRKALDARRCEEEVHLATWFRRMFINRDTFIKAIDKTIEINQETLGSINTVAALANHCCARDPQQRPDMTHVVSVFVSLVHQWKPDQHSEDAYVSNQKGEEPEGMTNVSPSRGDNTVTSITSRPPELEHSFGSGQGRNAYFWSPIKSPTTLKPRFYCLLGFRKRGVEDYKRAWKMSLPLLECKYVTEEFVREGKNGNYGSKLPSSVPMLRFLYELCWNLVRGELPIQSCKAVLEKVKFLDNPSREELASCFADVVTQIAQDLTMSADHRSRLTKLAKWLVESQTVPQRLFQERCEEEFLWEAEMVKIKAQDLKGKEVRLNTRLLYQQTKFNLLREESEGYAKLVTLLCRGSASSSHNTSAATMGIIKSLIGHFDLDPNRVFDIVLDCFELEQDYETFLNLIPIFPKSHASQILGFKFQYYQRLEVNNPVPSGLYKLTALLVKEEFISLESIYAHLLPKDEEIFEDYNASSAKRFEEANKIGKINLAAIGKDLMEDEKQGDFTVDLFAALDMETEAVTERLPELENNQTLGLLNGFLSVDDWYHANILFERLAPLNPVAHDQICGGLFRLIEKSIAHAYRIARQMRFQNSSSAGTEKSTHVASTTSSRSLDVPKEVFQMLLTVGPYLYRNTQLLQKICRVLRVYYLSALDLVRSSDGSSNQEGRAYETSRVHLKEVRLRVEEALGTCLLPSLQLVPANPAVGHEIWEVMSLLPYEARYRLYGEWEKDDERNPLLLAARQVAKLDTRHILKRLAKENLKPLGRMVAKLAHANPMTVLRTIVNQIESYRDMITPVVEAFKYLTQVSGASCVLFVC